MKVAVIGSRGFTDYSVVKDYLDRLNAMHPISVIVSGGAKGADSLGEAWADENGVAKCIYHAEWENLSHPDAVILTNQYGKRYDARAGHRRNRFIINDADLVLAFWDKRSKGTADAVGYAKSIGKPIKIINTTCLTTRNS